MKVEALKDGSLLAEARVEASNWMSALRVAREDIGEEGGVPPGASCSVAPNGVVTILDSVERRRLVLTPETPGEASQNASSASSSSPPTDVSSKGATPNSHQSSGPSKVEKSSKTRKRPRTVAYDVSAFKPPSSKETQPAAVKSEPPKTQPAAVKSEAPKSSLSADAGAKPAQPDEEFTLRLLHERNVDPSADNPVTYRERAFFSGDAPVGKVVTALHKAFEVLRAANDVKGLYINTAAFDHEWKERPSRPPVATLEFRAWKGDPVVATPLADAGQAPNAENAHRTNSVDAAKPLLSQQAPAQPNFGKPAPERPKPAKPITAKPSPEKPVAASPTPTSEPNSVPSLEESSTPAPAVELSTDDKSVSALDEGLNVALGNEMPPSSKSDSQQVKPARTLSDDFEMDDPEFAEVEEKERGIAAAFEACEDLRFLETPLDGIRFAERLLLELIEAEAFTGGLYDINASVYRIVSAAGPGGDKRRGSEIPQGKGIFGRVSLETGVLRTDKSDPRFDNEFDGRAGVEHKNAITAPVVHNRRVYAVLQVMNKKRGEFSEEDENIVRYVADQLAEFLHERHMRHSMLPR